MNTFIFKQASYIDHILPGIIARIANELEVVCVKILEYQLLFGKIPTQYKFSDRISDTLPNFRLVICKGFLCMDEVLYFLNRLCTTR